MDQFDPSAARVAHDLHPKRLHAQVMKSLDRGALASHPFVPDSALLDAAAKHLSPREIVMFALPTKQGSLFLGDETWKNLLLVVTDQRVLLCQVEKVEAIHLSKLVAVKMHKTGSAYKQLDLKFRGAKQTLNIHNFEFDNARLGWNSLIAFLSERCGGSWNVELPPHHPLEISHDISVDVTDIATIDASSPSVEAKAGLDPETTGDGAAGKSFVLFGCLIPFLYLLAGIIKIVSEAGSRGVWDATVIAFWWLHVPAGLTFLLVYFLTLSALVRRQHRISKNQTGAAGARVVDELPSVIFAIVFAATISYFVSMATGPFAPYDRCMKDLSDLGVHYEIRLESCSRYLP